MSNTDSPCVDTLDANHMSVRDVPGTKNRLVRWYFLFLLTLLTLLLSLLLYYLTLRILFYSLSVYVLV